MFPISDSIKSKAFPFVTIILIIVNIYVYFREVTASNIDAFITQFALIPSQVDFTVPMTLINFVTAMFLHAPGPLLLVSFHLISNMWFLWIFGDDVEDHVGIFNFLLLYFGAGIIGNALQYFMDPTSSIPMIGASGAVSGVLGAYYVFFPHSRIRTLVVIFFFITFLQIPASIYLLYWFVLQLISSAASGGAYQTGGVAFFAHIGGFLAGVFFARLFKKPAEKEYIEGEIVG